MILYMVLAQCKDGTTGYRIGGGSSTPSVARVYDSIGRARAYARGYPNAYITIVDTDKTENTV